MLLIRFGYIMKLLKLQSRLRTKREKARWCRAGFSVSGAWCECNIPTSYLTPPLSFVLPSSFSPPCPPGCHLLSPSPHSVWHGHLVGGTPDGGVGGELAAPAASCPLLPPAGAPLEAPRLSASRTRWQPGWNVEGFSGSWTKLWGPLTLVPRATAPLAPP